MQVRKILGTAAAIGMLALVGCGQPATSTEDTSGGSEVVEEEITPYDDEDTMTDGTGTSTYEDDEDISGTLDSDTSGSSSTDSTTSSSTDDEDVVIDESSDGGSSDTIIGLTPDEGNSSSSSSSN